jgi:hypothetical protein
MTWTTRTTPPTPPAGPPRSWAPSRRSCAPLTPPVPSLRSGPLAGAAVIPAVAARIRELFDQGHTLAAALRILALEDDLAAERALTARLHERLAGQDRPDEG